MIEKSPPWRLRASSSMFYAAFEVRDRPELAGKSLIIGHGGPRGVVSTCSYEARRFGVRSAMPSLRAERLCPQAAWLPGRMSHYVAVSRSIRALFDEATPVVEPLSIDEAFLVMGGVAHDLAVGRAAAERMKRRILEVEHLTASVGGSEQVPRQSGVGLGHAGRSRLSTASGPKLAFISPRLAKRHAS